MTPKLMTLKEFGEHLGISYSTVRRMVADKSIHVIKPHRRAMIPESELQKFTVPASGKVEERSTPT